jgi:hypothetical protein
MGFELLATFIGLFDTAQEETERQRQSERERHIHACTRMSARVCAHTHTHTSVSSHVFNTGAMASRVNDPSLLSS